ncbi:hypothetical protein RJT34_22703 [Clitoria ternatea]|uniref:Uncharacterized protein n=1 Tax=Clitoria ternatea TaxID=43366 RepID=A0AAN9IE95_CLITE
MKKVKGKNNGLLPSSLRIISSCLKTVSTNASTVASTVRSAGASVAASISYASEDRKDQVTWAGFDTLELDQSMSKRVLLLGYLNGFQVVDVEDASGLGELVSKRDGPVSFLQMQPLPLGSDGQEGFRKLHPLLLVVTGDDAGSDSQNSSHLSGLGRDGNGETEYGNGVGSATAVRFYSLKSHGYVHALKFRSVVCMIRCSSWIVAVGLPTQIYCFDASTLENKFSVLTYPVPQLAGQGTIGVNIGYGPMAVGSRWLAYASNNPLPSNVGCISPQYTSPSPGVSPSTSPSSGSLVARYAMESSKHLAAGIIKYCQELLPDGSNSPVSSNSGWKVGRVTGSEMDSAGMVIVKDIASRAIISQFKAHASPISALCFDPSGTLLMIQDICFSHFSQWIAIVSSKGTCHLFILSPFGGDTGFQIISSQGKEPSLLPVLSLPWWSTSSPISYQKSLPPPAPVVLSVVSRIKYSSFGWLNTVHNSSANVTGKVFVPSGAIAAIFHNSLSRSQQLVNSNANSLEHLLVYTPSGHVVQHELVPFVGAEPNESSFGSQSASILHMQEDEFRVKVEPIQWWDVCRRSEWPERGDPCCNIFDRQDGICFSDGHGLNFLDKGDAVGGKAVKPTTGKPQERFHWYLSNAEVQLNFGRVPIWQKSKICFYSMNSVRTGFNAGGESEIEMIPSNEVEIRRKLLLPVLDHFPSTRPSWNERALPVEKYPGHASQVPHRSEDKQTADMIVICHSKPASLSSTESSDGGSSRRIENLLDLDQVSSSCQVLGEICLERSVTINVEPSLQDKIMLENSTLYDHSLNDSPSSQGRNITSDRRDELEGAGINEGSALVLKHDLDNSKLLEIASVMQNACVRQSFSDENCETLGQDGSNVLTEVVTDDVDSNGSHNTQQPEDEENDEMLGGLFFSE